jgi:hypothetical protein
MPVQPMMCPRCGKEATEYDENKWQCLNPRCGAKFIYESPPETSRKEISITKTIQVATFTCRGCGGIFPMLQYPQYQCARCGETFCSECKSKGRPISISGGRDGFQCKHCVQQTKRRGCAVAILLVLGGLLLSAMFAPPSPSPPIRVSVQPPGREQGLFAANLGITYVRVPYDNDTFGARLIRDPLPGSPAAQLQFEPGDTIFSLDGMRFRTPEDVLAHRQWTSVQFISVRTNRAQWARVYIP